MTKVTFVKLATILFLLGFYFSFDWKPGRLCLNQNNSIGFAHSSLHTISYDLDDSDSVRYLRGEIKKYGMLNNYVYGYLNISNDDLEGLRGPNDKNGYFIIKLLNDYSYQTKIEKNVKSGLEENGFLKAMSEISSEPLKFSESIYPNQWWNCVLRT